MYWVPTFCRYPNANSGFAFREKPIGKNNFIVGDFIVVVRLILSLSSSQHC